MTTALIVTPSPDLLPAPLFAPTPVAKKRFIEFFTAQMAATASRLDVADADLQMALAVFAAAYEG
jgi:hypothetical protein